VSDSARPEKAAFKELESLVRHLGEELSGFRRRALQAEGRLKEIDTAATSGKPTPERLAALERENKDLTRRLKAATERVNGMLERVRFLREQSEAVQ
jgi:predicted  nucleic acid-binding Zn-ribbon protein